MKLFLNYLFIITFFTWVVLFGVTWEHETIHQEIFSIYDCSSEIKIHIGGMYTLPEQGCKLTTEMKILHAQNEIGFLPVKGMIMMLYVLSIVYLLFSLKEKERGEE